MLTRRELLKIFALLPWLTLAAGNAATSSASHAFCEELSGQPWVYPLTFPAYFPIRPRTSSITPMHDHKLYLPIVSKNG